MHVQAGKGKLADRMVPRHTSVYIGRETEGFFDLVPGGVEALGSALRSFTSSATNKWRRPGKHVRGTPRNTNSCRL